MRMRAAPAVLALIAATLPPAFAGESSVSQTAHDVDRLLAKETGLTSQQATPAGKVSDEVFLRRVTLDLTGELPTLNQITAFALDPDPDKRQKLVEKLLENEKFGRNWGRYWRDVIMYRRTEDRALLSAGALETWLSEQFNKNTPWSQIATEFITASGNVRENGATGLIMAQMGEAEQVTAEVSRLFLGIQIQCAQCHDHPSDKWKRQQFHQLAAFFPRVRVRPIREEQRIVGYEVVSADFIPRFARNRRGGTTEHYMPDLENPTAKGKLMTPTFFVNEKTVGVGTKDIDRRKQLADWITSPENPWFAKALVNRVWAELVGEGFYEPVDDMGPQRQSSAPETIDLLAHSFAEQNYDLKWLYRVVTSTEAYQRDSRSRRTPEQTPFAANCPQRLRADQLYDAVAKALGLADTQGPGRGGPMMMMYGRGRGPRFEFAQTFGYDPSEPRDEVAGSIPQALLMMNSPSINSAINGSSRNTVLGELLNETKDDRQVIAELYLRCLAREPSEQELKSCLAHIKDVDNRSEAFEDLLWALINTTEFLHRR